MARRPAGRTGDPRSADHPSKNTPRQQPCRVTAALCPLAVTARSIAKTRSRVSPSSGRAPRRACRRTGVLASSLDLLRLRAPRADQPGRVPAPQHTRRCTARRGRGVGPKAHGSLAVPPPPEGGGGVASIRRWSGTGSTSRCDPRARPAEAGGCPAGSAPARLPAAWPRGAGASFCRAGPGPSAPPARRRSARRVPALPWPLRGARGPHDARQGWPAPRGVSALPAGWSSGEALPTP
jgi:hypothetical protein